MEAQEWLAFVHEDGADDGQAFGKGMLLLEKLKPSKEESSLEVLQERLKALEEPLPSCFDSSPFKGLLEKSLVETRAVLTVACAALEPPLAVRSEGNTQDEENEEKQEDMAVEPSPQQIVNALYAMVASQKQDLEKGLTCLSGSDALNSFTHLTISDKKSPLKFVICEIQEGTDSEVSEIYVAFDGTECWADIANEEDFPSAVEPSVSGRYHHRFLERSSVFPVTGLAEKVLDGARLFLVGHGLGGSIAAVTTIEMVAKCPVLPLQRLYCITAGAPFAGDSDIQLRCEQLGIAQNLFHIVGPGDAFPRIISFLGAIKNNENGKNAHLREAVLDITRRSCRLAGEELTPLSSHELQTELPPEAFDMLFLGLRYRKFDPIGKYWLLSLKEAQECVWQPACDISLAPPTSNEELRLLLEHSSDHEIFAYCHRVCGAFSSSLSARGIAKPVESGAEHWRPQVEQCHMSMSNGRLACDIIGARLFFVNSISVGTNQFTVTSTSAGSSKKISVERNVTESTATDGGNLMITVRSMTADCSYSGELPVVMSEMVLGEQGDIIARLDVSQVIERLIRLFLFSPKDAVLPQDPLSYLEALMDCQPIETLYRLLAGREPTAVPATFNVLGRMPGTVKEMTDLGVSQGAIESLREALRHRLNQLDLRKISSEAATISRFAGAGAVAVKAASLASQLRQNAASLAVASRELAAAQRVVGNAAATYAAAGAAKIVAGGSHASKVAAVGRLGAGTGATAGKVAAAASAVSAASGQVQALTAAQSALGASAKFLGFASSYGLIALTAVTTAWETHALLKASRTVKKGSSNADLHQDLMDTATTSSGISTWDTFDEDMVRGIEAADELSSIIGKESGLFPPTSAKKVLAELFYCKDQGIREPILNARATLVRQREELHERQRIIREAASKSSQEETARIHREVEEDFAKMLDIHTFWIDFISAALSGKTDVALSRHRASAALWVSKLVLLDNVLQPWVPLVKSIVCGKSASQEALMKLREAVSYVIDPSTFDVRVNMLYNGIVGASDEHVFEGKELYSKLFAIRKHAPEGVTWQSDPADISNCWDANMVDPGIVPESALDSITKDSRFEVSCWLVSCLCVVELYDACMSTSAVALMGVTSTGKSSLARSMALNPGDVVAGAFSRHRTSIPLMHLCKPFAEGQKQFSVLDMAGHTDKENTVETGDGDEEEDDYLPGETYLPMTALCSSLVSLLPHRLAYVEPFRKQLLWLNENGRSVQGGSVKVFITKCEDIIEEALEMDNRVDAVAMVRRELEDEVRRIAVPSIMSMANTHYAVILNPRKYTSEDLRCLGVWELKDIHQWMSDRCNPESPSLTAHCRSESKAASNDMRRSGQQVSSEGECLWGMAQRLAEEYIASRVPDLDKSQHWNFVLALEASKHLWRQGLQFYVRHVASLEPPSAAVEPLWWMSALRDVTVVSFQAWLREQDSDCYERFYRLSSCSDDDFILRAPGLTIDPEFLRRVTMFSYYQAGQDPRRAGLFLQTMRGGHELKEGTRDHSCYPQEQQRKRQPLTYALLIGVERTHEDLQRLNGPCNDLKLVKRVLQRRMGPSIRVVVLSDEQEPITSETIREHLNKVLDYFGSEEGLERDGQVLIFFAGHACRLSENSFTVFLPSELPLSRAHRGYNTVELFLFHSILQSIRVNHSPIPVAVFLDCCYSGAIIDVQSLSRVPPSQERAFLSFVCSSARDQQSYEMPQERSDDGNDLLGNGTNCYGVFTWTYFTTLEAYPGAVFATSLAEDLCRGFEDARHRGETIGQVIVHADYPLGDRFSVPCFCFPEM